MNIRGNSARFAEYETDWITYRDFFRRTRARHRREFRFPVPKPRSLFYITPIEFREGPAEQFSSRIENEKGRFRAQTGIEQKVVPPQLGPKRVVPPEQMD